MHRGFAGGARRRGGVSPAQKTEGKDCLGERGADILGDGGVGRTSRCVVMQTSLRLLLGEGEANFHVKCCRISSWQPETLLAVASLRIVLPTYVRGLSRLDAFYH